MVDAAIVMIENAHKRLDRAAPDVPRAKVLIAAAVEVGSALFFSLLVITVSPQINSASAIDEGAVWGGRPIRCSGSSPLCLRRTSETSSHSPHQ
jgi:Cu(I)/Ag(I) efflux system membrane protein CusA/SilA